MNIPDLLGLVAKKVFPMQMTECAMLCFISCHQIWSDTRQNALLQSTWQHPVNQASPVKFHIMCVRESSEPSQISHCVFMAGLIKHTCTYKYPLNFQSSLVPLTSIGLNMGCS